MPSIPAQPRTGLGKGRVKGKTRVGFLWPPRFCGLTYSAPVYPGIVVQVIYVQYNRCAHRISSPSSPVCRRCLAAELCHRLPAQLLQAFLLLLDAQPTSSSVVCPEISARPLTKKPMQKTAGSGESWSDAQLLRNSWMLSSCSLFGYPEEQL